MPPDIIYLDGADAERIFPHPAKAASDMASQAGAANQAATIALAANSSSPTSISQVDWSYSGTPTTGNLQITGATVGKVRDLDITIGGINQIKFEPPLVFGTSEAVTVTLAAGGTGITGKVACVAWQLK